MYTIDIHANKETTDAALYELMQGIRFAKKEPDKVLCLIVGYGSSGGTHKIKTAVSEKLEELKNTKFIKDYIQGSNLDLFDPVYLNFKYKDFLPESEKKHPNPGCIYVIV